ncbi:MAG: DUF87 domain-containing protein [Myxococcales bacterium]|nr:DUF87 domain-containing protein [Myxococcales bacterium]
MALEALRVRIVAPIPGKAAVGIEVPNKTREKVFMKEIVADDTFRRTKAKLPMAIGKDIEGAPAVVDLARMPHLLVAGTTGSGKSVAVNAMISSLLYSCSPEDVRFIMVDPKMLELSIYEGIPHLLLPVVTDPKKANLALRWAVDEMERRYDLLAHAGVRDITGYNDKIGKARAKWEAEQLRRAADAAEAAVGAAVDVDDDQIEHVEITGEHAPMSEPAVRLPYIVVVIDEFADLMMCAPKEVETSVARIAQKARAAGIHLILATQRPSVDVITGLIKANFPSRIAFHVTSKIDSRTILDQGGAGRSWARATCCSRIAARPRPASTAATSTRRRSTASWRSSRPRAARSTTSTSSSRATRKAPRARAARPRATAAARSTTRCTTRRSTSCARPATRRSRGCSASCIGYNRAARLVEEMEKQGVVSSPDHSNKREVLVAAA